MFQAMLGSRVTAVARRRSGNRKAFESDADAQNLGRFPPFAPQFREENPNSIGRTGNNGHGSCVLGVRTFGQDPGKPDAASPIARVTERGAPDENPNITFHPTSTHDSSSLAPRSSVSLQALSRARRIAGRGTRRAGKKTRPAEPIALVRPSPTAELKRQLSCRPTSDMNLRRAVNQE